MAAMGLGTDTGGSCRIPAAFTGITGYKPTARRVPLDGVVPLALSLDSVGPLARTVACCALVDAVIAGEAPRLPAPWPVRNLRLAVPQTFMLDGLDAAVASDFEAALGRLSAAGAAITEIGLEALADIPALNAKGGVAAAESYAWHRELLARRGDDYDPRVRSRILRGAEQSAADYLDLAAARADLIDRVAAEMRGHDALAFPTAPIIAPAIAALADDDDYGRINALSLRNAMVVNLLDGCGISLPIHAPGSAPVGLTLAAGAMSDRRLFAVARTVEAVLQS